MMRTIVAKSKLLHVTLALLLVFFPFVFLIDAAKLYVLLGTILCTVSISVVHAYWPPLKIALKQSVTNLNFVDYLTMALVLVFMFNGIREGYVIYNQIFDPLPVSRSDDFYIPLALTRYGIIVAGYMALAARHFLMGPRFLNAVPGWPRAVISVLAGSVIGGVILTFFP